MSNIVTTYRPPLRRTLGPDGVPHYISAQAGDPQRWTPPPGRQLRVFCDGQELHFVVECDRSRGWARTHAWEMAAGRPRMLDKKAADGTPLLRLYHGRITYQLVRAAVPKWLRSFIRSSTP